MVKHLRRLLSDIIFVKTLLKLLCSFACDCSVSHHFHFSLLWFVLVFSIRGLVKVHKDDYPIRPVKFIKLLCLTVIYMSLLSLVTYRDVLN